LYIYNENYIDMKLPLGKIINSTIYPGYDFEPWTKKMIIRDKWKRKLKCKNKQIRRRINRLLDNLME
jgi:hypothetical protein